MAINPAVVLWGPTVVGTTAAVVYASPANTTTTITRGVFTNTGASNLGLSVWVVRSKATAQNTNLITGAASGGLTMLAGPSTAYIAPELAGLVLGPGDAIWAQASSTGLNTVGSGWTQ